MQIPGGREDEEGKEEKRVNGKEKEKKRKENIKIGNRKVLKVPRTKDKI